MNTKPKLIDLTFLAEFTKGDSVKMKRYIEMYLNSAPQIVGQFQTELDKNDFESLRLKAHSIKPQAQYMGISSLKEVLIQIETIVKSGKNFDKLSALVEKANLISQQAIVELQSFLKNS